MNSTFKPTPEDKLILFCARTEMNEKIEEKIRSTVLDVTDWSHVLEMADHHRLNHLLYFHLNHICPEECPDDVMCSLKNYFNLNVQKNLFMFGEMIKILDIFKVEGIDALPYKGPVLAFFDYKNLALREFTDLDIFVHQKDVSRVRKILMSVGYNLTIDLNEKEERKFVQTMRDFVFCNDLNRITLEIHWRFQSTLFSLPNSTELFNWDDCNTVDLQNNQILISAPEDMLLILCLHNAGHRWKRISLLCDLREFLSANEINWSKFIHKSKRLGVNRLVGINFYLTNELLNLNIPDHIFEELISDNKVKSMSNGIRSHMFSIEPNLTNLIQETMLSYNLRENKLLGIKDVIRGATFPEILDWESVRLPVVLFPAYYLLRPFLLLKRYLL